MAPFDADEINRLISKKIMSFYYSTLLGSGTFNIIQGGLTTHTLLREAVNKMVRIANGEIEREIVPPSYLAIVEEDLARVLRILWGSPLRPEPQIPPEFWSSSPVGQMLARVTQWLYGAELIPLIDAARLLYPDRDQLSNSALLGRLRRLIEAGELTLYFDPAVRNARQARRVRRSEILALRARLEAQEQSA